MNAAEAINTAGGVIVGDDGKTPSVDSPEAAKGLSRLADAYKNGDIPKQAITYTEEQGRASFEAGKLLFLRNWPYVYSLATTDGSSKVKGKFAVAPLPGDAGKPGASSLGGHNAAISAYSAHKATAFDFLKFLETEEIAAVLRDPGLPRAGPRRPCTTTLRWSRSSVPAGAEDLHPTPFPAPSPPSTRR